MKKLTKEKASDTVKYIEDNVDNYDIAFASEKGMYLQFIENIVADKYDTMEEMKEVAEVILKTKEIDYEQPLV